jgi:hypothetical protein
MSTQLAVLHYYELLKRVRVRNRKFITFVVSDIRWKTEEETEARRADVFSLVMTLEGMISASCLGVKFLMTIALFLYAQHLL